MTSNSDLINENVGGLDQKMNALKLTKMNLFDSFDKVNMFNLRFYILDHMCDNLSHFGIVLVSFSSSLVNSLNTLAFHNFNYIFKVFIATSYIRIGTTTAEFVNAMKASCLECERSCVLSLVHHPNCLSRNGTKKSLEAVYSTP